MKMLCLTKESLLRDRNRRGLTRCCAQLQCWAPRVCYQFLVLTFFASLLYSQNTPAEQLSDPTFESRVRVVIVDVVVTDKNGHLVRGLTKDDFEVLEGTGSGRGDKQNILSFEEHDGLHPQRSSRPPLPQHFYTNAPAVPSNDSINVLLLDALNTHSEDQAAVRRDMISFLKSIDPGQRLAIFTLGSRLRLVEGFSSDSRVLVEALMHKKWGGEPQASTLLRSEAEDAGEQKMLQSIADAHGSNDAIKALQQFLDETKATENVSRTSMTLQALRELAQYLSGFPGRKNLIWISGSFPTVFSSKEDVGDDRGLGIEFKRTINLMTAAQIAVYPIAAQGLGAEPLFQASQTSPLQVAQSKSSPLAQRITEGENERLRDDALARNLDTEAADEIASSTGGKAFVNANNVKDALTVATDEGSHYYSLSYAPSDKRTLGRFRHIHVITREGHYTLAYRNGYFEDDEKDSKRDTSRRPEDPLQSLLLRGLPDSTQIAFDLRVVRSSVQSETGNLAGDNKALHGPLTRLSADFFIPIDSLAFEMSSDGVRHGSVELALVAYDHNGNPLNWLFRSIKTSLKPEVYPSVRQRGAQFHEEFDIPAGENYLRAGIYDLQSDKAGTLEIPLTQITELASSVISPNQTRNEFLPLPSSSGSQQNPLAGPTSISAPIMPNDRSTSSPIGSRAGDRVRDASKSELPALQDTDSTKIDSYCTALAVGVEMPEALAKVCKFALAVRTKLPDVICEENVRRNWSQLEEQIDGGRALVAHSDVVTAKLAYKNGQEYYSNIRVDGTAVDSARPPGGDWSEGEFASALFAVFARSSKTAFRFKKRERLGSRQVAVFDFQVAAENNKSYFLRAGDQLWYPEYSGTLWIDIQKGQITRFERKTVPMTRRPINRTETKISYDDLRLGDGSSIILPTEAETFTCSAPLRDHSDVCSRNSISFKNWRKFHASTTIVYQPSN